MTDDRKRRAAEGAALFHVCPNTLKATTPYEIQAVKALTGTLLTFAAEVAREADNKWRDALDGVGVFLLDIDGPDAMLEALQMLLESRQEAISSAARAEARKVLEWAHEQSDHVPERCCGICVYEQALAALDRGEEPPWGKDPQR